MFAKLYEDVMLVRVLAVRPVKALNDCVHWPFFNFLFQYCNTLTFARQSLCFLFGWSCIFCVLTVINIYSALHGFWNNISYKKVTWTLNSLLNCWQRAWPKILKMTIFVGSVYPTSPSNLLLFDKYGKRAMLERVLLFRATCSCLSCPQWWRFTFIHCTVGQV